MKARLVMHDPGRVGRVLSIVVLSLVLVGAGIIAGRAGAEEGEGVERRFMRVEDREARLYHPGGAWRSMLRFDTSATYEYDLTRRGTGRTAHGKLTVQVNRSFGGSSLALSYEVDGKRDGVWVRPMVATPGETLMAALLTATNRWDERDINLLWTPFIFTRWAAHFGEMPWRTGVAWTTRSADTEAFSVDRILRDRRDNTIFRGHLERNGRPILELDVNLDLPLPEYVSWVDGSGARYEAEMVWEKRSPIRM